jgi:hypothetical protein
MQFASGKLSGKKSSNKNQERVEVPSHTEKNPAGNNERNGGMDCQNPLRRKSANP